ncbi:TPA: hypothetical protein ACIS09_001673 [Salmonella enterica subsp. enterica serovar Birkenhead]
MNTDTLFDEAKKSFFPDLDKLSEEFYLLQEEHPEIYQSEIVNAALDNYGGKLKAVSFESIAAALIGMREVEFAHKALNNAAKYVITHHSGIAA